MIVWDTEEMVPVANFAVSPPGDVLLCFSKDSRLLVITCSDGAVTIHRLGEFEQPLHRWQLGQAPRAVAWLSDQDQVAISCEDKTVRVFDLLGNEKAVLDGPANGDFARSVWRTTKLHLI